MTYEESIHIIAQAGEYTHCLGDIFRSVLQCATQFFLHLPQHMPYRPSDLSKT